MQDERVVVVIDGELKRRFKLLCAITGETMKERIVRLMEKDVNGHKERLDSLS